MAASITFEIDTEELRNELNRVSKQISIGAATKAVDQTAAQVVRTAKTLTPVQTGKLRDSLKKQTRRENDRIVSVISSDVDYSLKVHEDLTAFHPSGQAKFLSQPLTKSGRLLKENLKREIEKVR